MTAGYRPGTLHIVDDRYYVIRLDGEPNPVNMVGGEALQDQQTDGYATWQEARAVALQQPDRETIHVTIGRELAHHD